MSQGKAAPAPTAKRPPRTLAGSVPAPQDGSRAAALASYEAALHLMQNGRYDEAHAAFGNMLLSSPPELAERIRMYINACLLQIAKGTTSFHSHEEQYDFAISLLNDGKYPDAREQFKQILAANPTADYAFYGLAVLSSMTGDSHECLDHLTNAIKHNPRNRIQARADSDFQDMADDPRVTELLYPES
jgi:tetratricopeptide (TPR) repeat protein